MRSLLYNRFTAVTTAAAIAALTFTGCGSAPGTDLPEASEETSVQTESSVEEMTAQEAPVQIAEEKTEETSKTGTVTVGDDNASVKIGMVTDTAGINDHSFNQSAWDGLLFLNDNLNARVSYIPAAGTDEFVADLSRLADEGNDVCWGIGYQFADAILDAAEMYPDKHFAIVDYMFDEIPDNVTCAMFNAEEPSFLVGYIAGRCTQSGKVGFIGGMDVEALHAFQYGYMAGVEQADSETGDSTEVLCEYIGTFDDAAKGRQAAEAMYDEGCDVIFHAAGGAGVGVIEAAADMDKYVIGVDCDQSYLAPGNVLTSAVKKVDVIVSNISVQYGMGDNIGGRMIKYGLKEHAVGFPDEHPLVSDEIYDAAKALEQKIMFGGLEVPFDEASYDAFSPQ